MAASFLEEKKTTLYCLKGKGGKEALKKELEEEGIQAEDGFLCEGALRISGYDSSENSGVPSGKMFCAG